MTPVNILLIDDDPMIHAVIRKIMALNGFELISAQSVQEGIDKLKTTDISLIISDVMMTGIDGLSFLSILKKDGQYQSVPVLIITSNQDASVAELAFKQGAAGFLTKPVSEQDLVNLVRTFASLRGEGTGIAVTDDFLLRKLQKITSRLTQDALSLNYTGATGNFLKSTDELFDFSTLAFYTRKSETSFELQEDAGILNFLEELRYVSTQDIPNLKKMVSWNGPVFSNDALRYPNVFVSSWANRFSLVSEVMIPFYRYTDRNSEIGLGANRKTTDIIGFFWGFRNTVLSSKECELLIRIFTQANPILFDLSDFSRNYLKKTT